MVCNVFFTPQVWSRMLFLLLQSYQLSKKMAVDYIVHMWLQTQSLASTQISGYWTVQQMKISLQPQVDDIVQYVLKNATIFKKILRMLSLQFLLVPWAKQTQVMHKLPKDLLSKIKPFISLSFSLFLAYSLSISLFSLKTYLK